MHGSPFRDGVTAMRVPRALSFGRVGLALLLLCCASACSSLRWGPGGLGTGERPSFTQIGLASWYGSSFHRRQTASGERFDMHAMTAAHRTLPFDTVVRVTNLENGRMVKVRINDRGPYVKGRIIDLSAEAAGDLAITENGVAKVKVEAFPADQPTS